MVYTTQTIHGQLVYQSSNTVDRSATNMIQVIQSTNIPPRRGRLPHQGQDWNHLYDHQLWEDFCLITSVPLVEFIYLVFAGTHVGMRGESYRRRLRSLLFSWYLCHVTDVESEREREGESAN